ncbi:MAG: hypothetical protein WKG07_48170 [Hymenobacter sp.]
MPDSLRFTCQPPTSTTLLAGTRDAYDGRNLAGVVLLSDGLVNQGQQPAAYSEFNFPDLQRGASATRSPRKDLRLTDLAYNRVAFSGNKFPLEAEIGYEGYAGGAATVERARGRPGAGRAPRGPTRRPAAGAHYVSAHRARARQAPLRGARGAPGRRVHGPQQRPHGLCGNREGQAAGAAGRRRAPPRPQGAARRHSGQRQLRPDAGRGRRGARPTPGAELRRGRAAPAAGPAAAWGPGPAGAGARRQACRRCSCWGRSRTMTAYNQLGCRPERAAPRGADRRRDAAAQPRLRPPRQWTRKPPALRGSTRRCRCRSATLRLGAGAEAALWQQVGRLPTQKPLLVFGGATADPRSATLLAEGTWQWRLQEAVAHDDRPEAYDRLLSRTLQLLTQNANKKRLDVYPTRRTAFGTQDDVTLGAETYNAVFERIYDQKIDPRPHRFGPSKPARVTFANARRTARRCTWGRCQPASTATRRAPRSAARPSRTAASC